MRGGDAVGYEWRGWRWGWSCLGWEGGDGEAGGEGRTGHWCGVVWCGSGVWDVDDVDVCIYMCIFLARWAFFAFALSLFFSFSVLME